MVRRRKPEEMEGRNKKEDNPEHTIKEFSPRIERCPTKRKNHTLEAWLVEVELWDKANNVGEPAIINPKKYLA